MIARAAALDNYLRGGKEKVVRRYDPVTNDYKYTALGKRFYGRQQIQYVVQELKQNVYPYMILLPHK